MADADWALFDRWCLASGRDPQAASESDVEAFFAQVPATGSTITRRLRAIRSHNPQLRPPERVRETVRPSLLRETIEDCPPTVRGARDRLLLTLVEAGLPRRLIGQLTPDDVDIDGWTIAGVQLAQHPHPARCPRCALSSWLGVLPELASGFRIAARDAVGQLDCGQEIVGRWREAPVLLPPIDRYGWCAGTPLTKRSIARVLSRPAPGGTRRRGLGDTPARATVVRPVRRDEALFDAWGDVGDRADELAAKLSDIEGALLEIADVVGDARGPKP